MQADRQSLKTSIYFLLDNRESATIVEYIAGKYGLSLNPQKTLAQNAQSLIDHLMQYTGSLDDGSDEITQRFQPNVSREPARTIENVPRQITLAFKQRLHLAAYMGKWYSAASIPQPFDRGTAWKTADYEVLPTNNSQLPMVKVTNTAYNQDGSVRASIVGTARVLDAINLAALYVSFPTGQPEGQTSPRANYLIHDTDYDNYAVVGSYDGSNLYLLVRQRPIRRSFYNDLVQYAERLGYDVERLVEDYGAIQ